jgi:hypothetical protein
MNGLSESTLKGSALAYKADIRTKANKTSLKLHRSPALGHELIKGVPESALM